MAIKRSVCACLALCLLGLGCSRNTSQQANKAAGDDSKSGARRVLQNKGSDTLVNVAQAWAEAYKRVNPQLAIT